MEIRQADTSDNGIRFLPNFCTAPAVVEILLIAELVAMVLTMARALQTGATVLNDFISISLFMLWQALLSAAALCFARRRLQHLQTREAYLVCYTALLMITALLSAGTIIASQRFNLGLVEFGATPFFVRNLSISAIVSAVALRYLHVQYQWQRQIQTIARSRIEALQARIRPHFLFNSLNTIAALIETSPKQAERTVEDLADLFRESMKDPGTLGSFGEELEFAEMYLRLEQQRLGERLRIEWQVDAIDRNWPIPRLTLQPLLENAIYHGIEQLPDGGCIRITAARHENVAVIRIENPLPAHTASRGRENLHFALDNTRERLKLVMGGNARLSTEMRDSHFETVLMIPRMD